MLTSLPWACLLLAPGAWLGNQDRPTGVCYRFDQGHQTGLESAAGAGYTPHTDAGPLAGVPGRQLPGSQGSHPKAASSTPPEHEAAVEITARKSRGALPHPHGTAVLFGVRSPRKGAWPDQLKASRFLSCRNTNLHGSCRHLWTANQQPCIPSPAPCRCEIDRPVWAMMARFAFQHRPLSNEANLPSLVVLDLLKLEKCLLARLDIASLHALVSTAQDEEALPGESRAAAGWGDEPNGKFRNVSTSSRLGTDSSHLGTARSLSARHPDNLLQVVTEFSAG